MQNNFEPYSIRGLIPDFKKGKRFIEGLHHDFINSSTGKKVVYSSEELFFFLLDVELKEAAGPDVEKFKNQIAFCRAHLKSISFKTSSKEAIARVNITTDPATAIITSTVEAILQPLYNKYYRHLLLVERSFISMGVLNYNLTRRKKGGSSTTVEIDMSKMSLLDNIKVILIKYILTPDLTVIGETKSNAELYLDYLSMYVSDFNLLPVNDTDNEREVRYSISTIDSPILPDEIKTVIDEFITSALFLNIIHTINQARQSPEVEQKSLIIKPVLLKEPLALEKQKFAYAKDRDFHEAQKKAISARSGNTYDVVGFKLTEHQEKGLHAIKVLLNATNYQGNRPPKPYNKDHDRFEDASSWSYSGSLPVLSFTLAEYYEAYGLKKKLTSRGYMEYDKDQRKLAKEALRYFGETKFLFISERTYTPQSRQRGKAKRGKPETKSDLIIATSSLYDIVESWIGIDQDKAKDIKEARLNGEDDIEEAESVPRIVTLELKPIWVKGINTAPGEPQNFFLRNANWLEEIELLASSKPQIFNDKTGVGKPSVYTRNFISYLHLQHKEKSAFARYNPLITISWATLARTLKIPESTIVRTKATAYGILQKQYRIAKELGYLTDYKQTGTNEVLTLNKAKFPSGEPEKKEGV